MTHFLLLQVWMDHCVVSMLFNRSKMFHSFIIFIIVYFNSNRILSTISIYAPLTSVDFHPNGSLVAVGTMGQHAAIYDLRDPKTKLAHLINKEHGNVYSIKFETGQTTNISKSTTLIQEVIYFS